MAYIEITDPAVLAALDAAGMATDAELGTASADAAAALAAALAAQTTADAKVDKAGETSAVDPQS